MHLHMARLAWLVRMLPIIAVRMPPRQLVVHILRSLFTALLADRMLI